MKWIQARLVSAPALVVGLVACSQSVGHTSPGPPTTSEASATATPPSVSSVPPTQASATPSPVPCGGYTLGIPEGSVPAARRGGTFVYDKVTDQTILFGGDAGQAAGQVPNGTWIWTGTAWTLMHPASAPPCWRYSAASVYDDATGEVVLFGGQGPPQSENAGWGKRDTWTWNGRNWTLRDPVTTPPAMSWAAMAYFPPTKKVVMFGGPETWLWDGRDWSQLASTDPTPPGRSAGALAYDGHQLILFGGFRLGTGQHYLDDTWAFDGTRWRQLQPANSPPARSFAGVVQQGPDGVVIGGGASESVPGTGMTFYNDMWRWDGSNWTRLSTSMPGPANRYLLMTTQDTRRGVGLLFGGTAGWKDLNDLWAWDGHVWSALSVPS